MPAKTDIYVDGEPFGRKPHIQIQFSSGDHFTCVDLSPEEACELGDELKKKAADVTQRRKAWQAFQRKTRP